MLFCPSNDGSRGHSFVSVGGRGHRYLMRCVAVYNHKRSSQHTDSTTELHGGVCLMPPGSITFVPRHKILPLSSARYNNELGQRKNHGSSRDPTQSLLVSLSLSLDCSFVRSFVYISVSQALCTAKGSQQLAALVVM